ncbi:hypothetical protein, partial [Enterobacter sp. PN108E5IIB]
FSFAEDTDDLFIGKTLLHVDVLMWLMKTLLTSRCINQRGAGHHDWQGVHSFYKNYRQCDEGYIAEGISATIVGLLANNWNTSHQLMQLSVNDRAFESWMINHIDTTTNDRELDKVVRNAADSCPEGGKAFCEQIENAAQGALKELQSQ